MNRRLQPRATSPQPLDSPYLTSKGAIEYLALPSLSSLYHHIRENGLPVCRIGGDLRFDKRDLDAWVRGTTAIELMRARRSDHAAQFTNSQQKRTA